ncbi:adhesive plaque matrix protein-like [Anopheles cruzii]|uniref:adhesive plaque matrix protein-like n=1 Tax=Anopheles cruzii TaxID=68878 RepID=UPI0022EC6DDB|nr:adhesive plaque matrix protein-like [Anopheles cruzii]
MSSVTVVALTLALVCLWARESSCSGPMYGAKASSKPDDASTAGYEQNAKPDKRVGIYPTTPNVEQDSSSSESAEHHASSDDHYGPLVQKFHDCYHGHLPLSLCVQLPADAPMKLSKHVMQQMVNSLMRDPLVHHGEVPCKAPKKHAHGKPYHHSHESGEKKVYGEVKKPCPKEYPQPPCKVCHETHEHKPHGCKKYSHLVFGKALEHTKKPCGYSAESHEPPKKDYPVFPASGEFYHQKKPCEHKKPCSCSAETYEPPKKDYPGFPSSGESYHQKKPCEHKKPCSCSAESYEPPKKEYPGFPASGEFHHPKKPCEHKKPCSCSAETYEPPKKDYSYPSSGESYHLKKPCEHKKPCSCSVESFVTPKKPYSFPCSHESAGSHEHPKKPYQPYPKEYSSGESYKPDYVTTPQVYNAPKKPCGAHPEPPYYKSTTPAPHPTAYPTPRSTAHPVPYRTTCTAGHYTPYTEPPRYPSMSYNSPSYPKPTYEHNRYDHKDCESASTYPKPPYHFDQQPRQNY